jgi:transposase
VPADTIQRKRQQAKRQQAKRQPLPANLPRREVRHEPENTTCACGCQMKRIGEDVAEKLDYEPGVFTVERHVRGKWACAKCEKLVQAPVAPHVIDKGIPKAGLLAQVPVAKYADHLPLDRQEGIFARAGFAIPRSALAQWVGSAGVQLQPLVDAMRDELLRHPVLHADETPDPHGRTAEGSGPARWRVQRRPGRAALAGEHRQGRRVRDADGEVGSVAREVCSGWRAGYATQCRLC